VLERVATVPRRINGFYDEHIRRDAVPRMSLRRGRPRGTNARSTKMVVAIGTEITVWRLSDDGKRKSCGHRRL
jgi:hypothetical protein